MLRGLIPALAPFQAVIPYVIVNGQVVIDQGNYTGARPDRALRHQVSLK